MGSDDFIGSAFGADEDGDDYTPDDLLFGDDPDFNYEADLRDLAAGEFGKVKARKKARKAKRARKLEQILMPITRTAVAAGAAFALTVEPDRDCRLLDVRCIGTVAATGVEDPGIVLTGLTVGGSNLFNAAGTFIAANVHPRDRRPGCYNLMLKKLVRQSTVITLSGTNVTAAAISVDASFLVRCRVS